MCSGIEKATEMYREECEKSGSEEAKRRFRELSMMYLERKTLHGAGDFGSRKHKR